MAVEARHMNLFTPSQLSAPSSSSPDTNYNLRYGVPIASLETTPPLLPPPLKSDNCSGLTYNVPVSRKRSRESPAFHHYYTAAAAAAAQREYHNTAAAAACCASSFSFPGELEDDDISLIRIQQQQQLDVDRLIAQHTEKVRLEIEEKRKNEAKRIMEWMEDRLLKRLRTKDEEIQKMANFNYALQERIKSLAVDNQIWRDLAHSNEATANALRTNLHQLLLLTPNHKHNNHPITTATADEEEENLNQNNPLMDDAQSCCDSCGVAETQAEEVETEAASRDRRWWCRNCGRGEARVLLLPCRHLCLCGVCGSSVHTCPVCKAPKTASVHVNVS